MDINIHEILKQPIKTDLLEHYTKYITMVQDWESVRVFDVKESKDAKEVILDYCYARVKDGDEKGTWGKCNRKGKDCKKQCGIDIFIDQKERSILNDNNLRDKLLNNQEKHIVYSEINLGNMHKALLEDIFTERYIPELDEYDKTRCKSKIVLYEYPSYTIFPEDEQKEYTLGLYYERQQVEIMRQLATKFKVLRHGIKAAVTAIMARNMSHNIGSHVLSYWGNKLKNKIDSKENTNASELEPSKYLFDYLKKRMDFIAEITTTVPAWEKTLSLKNDIIEDFQKQFAILDNIARSEGFCYYKDCSKMTANIPGVSMPSSNCADCFRLPHNLKKPSNDELKSKEPEPLKITYSSKDFHVSIPHGIVGEQAFYSILENFIRNSAKHGGRKIRDRIKSTEPSKPTALEFTIQAEESKEYSDYIKITISDNIGNCCDVVDKEKNKRVIDVLSEAIKDDEYIKSEDGRIKKGSWGIKEMKVSANFLRKKEVDALVSGHNNKDEPPIIQLTCYSNCEKNKTCNDSNNKNISFTFYLRKPKEACIVSDNRVTGNSEYGIDVFSYKNFKDKLGKETIPHRFLVFDKNDEDILSFIDDNRNRLPCRIIIINKKTPKKVTLENNAKLKDRWLSPAYIANIANIANIRFDQIPKNPDVFLLNLYENFVSDKIKGGSHNILMRNIKSSNGEWAENGICIIAVPTSPTGLKDLIIFDNHHGMITKDENGIVIIPDGLFYQGISGSTSFGKTLENIPKGNEKKIFLKELVEAALVKVLIADERIWKNSQDEIITPENNIPVKRIELLKKMGIYLVPIDGNIITDDEKAKVLNNFDDIVFFIIHKGLVEKMNDLVKEANSNLGTKFVKDVVAKFPFVLIDSGRGEPDNLEPGTRYVPMSAIESFIEDMDKYSLVQTLFSVRRSENAK